MEHMEFAETLRPRFGTLLGNKDVKGERLKRTRRSRQIGTQGFRNALRMDIIYVII